MRIACFVILSLCFISFGFTQSDQQDFNAGQRIDSLVAHAKSISGVYSDSAISILKYASHLANKQKDGLKEAKIAINIDRVFKGVAQYDSAKHYALKSLRLALDSIPEQVVFSARALAECYNKLWQLDSAVYYYGIAEQARQEDDYSAIHLYVLMEMKDLWGHIGDMEQYDRYLRKSIDFIDNAQSLPEVHKIVSLHDILSSCLYRNDSTNFSRYLSVFLELIKPFEKDIALPQYHVELFKFSMESDDEWMKQMIDYLPVHRDLQRWENLALTYYLVAKRKYDNQAPVDEVLELIDSCIAVSRRYQIPKYLIPQYTFKEAIYTNNGDYRNAYQSSKSLALLTDSLKQIELLKNIDALNVQFETQKKENRILEQQLIIQKRNRQRNTLIATTLGLILAIVFYEMRRRSRNQIQRLKHLKSLQEKDMQVAQSQMSLLRSQMNPHFLFNSLNSIKHYIIQKSTEESAQYISDFSKLMRMNLQNSAEMLVSLDREIAFLKQYLHMEQMRFKDPFEVRWKISEDLILESFQVPPMLIQPYLENAIWHGIRHKSSKGIIEIQIASAEKSGLDCIIEDNGIGRKKAAEMKSSSFPLKKSMGTQITTRRIKMANEILSTDIQVNTEDLYDHNGKATGTRVRIHIPIIKGIQPGD